MLLGNASVAQIEDRLAIKFPDEFRKSLMKSRQEYISTGIDEGRWHCFNHPFTIIAGDKETRDWIVSELRKLEDDMVGSINVNYDGGPKFDEYY